MVYVMSDISLNNKLFVDYKIMVLLCNYYLKNEKLNKYQYCCGLIVFFDIFLIL